MSQSQQPSPEIEAVLESSPNDDVRHSKEDALDERGFELYVEGTMALEPPYDLEAKFIAFAAGRLGMRLGEMVHIKEDWVDWRNKRIEIPHHEGCRKGRDGGMCSLCAQQARQKAESHEGITAKDLEPHMWRAKTEAAARSIPFDFDARTELAVERFFDRYDHWPYSHSTLQRRVEWTSEAAHEIDADDLYAHALRATAATWHASRGLSSLELTGMFGWVDISTAENYVASNPENLSRALNQAHS